MNMERKEIEKVLRKAYLRNEYGDYENFSKMADNICPAGYIIKITADDVEVFTEIADLRLCADDLLSLVEGGSISIDDIDIRIIK